MVYSTRIFRNLDFGIEWVLRCKAMKLESLRCIVNRTERIVAVRPIVYIRYIWFVKNQKKKKKEWEMILV